MRTRRTVAIVAETGRAIGHGHWVRARCLAGVLEERHPDTRVVLLCVGDVDEIEPSLHAGAARVPTPTDVALAHAVLAFGKAERPTHWVFDLAGYSDARVAMVASVNGHRTSFGLPLDKSVGDVIVNVAEAGDPPVTHERIGGIGGIEVFRGPEHVFLAPDVLAARGSHEPDGRTTLLVVFGGTDPTSLILDALHGLRASARPVVAVCDERHPAHATALALARSNPNACIEDRFEDAAAFLSRGSLLITAPGNLLFEGACVGIPVLCFCQNDDQWEDFRHCTDVHPRAAIGRIAELAETRLERERTADTRLAGERIGAGTPALIDLILRS